MILGRPEGGLSLDPGQLRAGERVLAMPRAGGCFVIPITALMRSVGIWDQIFFFFLRIL